MFKNKNMTDQIALIKVTPMSEFNMQKCFTSFPLIWVLFFASLCWKEGMKK